MPLRNQISPACAQELLDSASNAHLKGQAQYLTDPDLAKWLAQPLPKHRGVLVDFAGCGPGNLLTAAANRTTKALLGCDIQPLTDDASHPPHRSHFIPADFTRLAPLLAEVGWVYDLGVFNPPFGLGWYRERLGFLHESGDPRIREAFAHPYRHPGIPEECIDSGLATFLCALHFLSHRGEFLMLWNAATADRLLFADGAPYADLAQYVWGHLRLRSSRREEAPSFFPCDVCALYVSAIPSGGCEILPVDDAIRTPNPISRAGRIQLDEYWSTKDTVTKWDAVRQQLLEAAGRKPDVPWNLYLDNSGRIVTALSKFEEFSGKTDKAEVARLHNLGGRTPMELVLQRQDRQELLRAAGLVSSSRREEAPTPDSQSLLTSAATMPRWRVQPALLTAVQSALAAYDAARAPLYPLSPTQRLGYLDEQDTIECLADVSHPSHSSPLFFSGHTYKLRSQTVLVERKVTRPNAFTGEDELFLCSGQEQAFFLEGENGEEYSFLDGRLRDDPNVTISDARRSRRQGRSTVRAGWHKHVVDFDHAVLLHHFRIPEVPDVAAVHPGRYAENLKALETIEQLANTH